MGKTRTVRDIVARFQSEMQKMVDDPHSGVSAISMTFGGKTVTIADKQPVVTDADERKGS